MKAPNVITLDFETNAIEDRPSYPPEPVGFSIKWPRDRVCKYHAWGHPTQNTTDKRNAVRILQEAWASELPILFHNAKFDYEVATEKLGLGKLPWEKIHDTLFLVFLDNPHADSFGLKPSALRILDMAPTEQEAVKVWLIKHVGQVNGERITDKNFGKHIAKAPGKLVGEYANGDVIRTLKLFQTLYPSIKARGMESAYNRERKLLPILIDNERMGMSIDCIRLDGDVEIYRDAIAVVDRWLRKRLKSPDINLDSNKELADALDLHGIVTDWSYTKTGQRSTAKENMGPGKFNDAKVAAALGYRNRLSTCLSTFMLPWQAQARLTGGTINTSWNQVRQSGGSKSQGTRTGRPSSMRPNFLNVPKTFGEKNDGYLHPTHISRLPQLPFVRKYILPDRGGLWLHRDYNQQELRILAHFENDQILAAYKANPDLDIHAFVQAEIKRLAGMEVARSPVKILNFGRIYGEGLGSMAPRLNMSVKEVMGIRDAQNRALPGLPKLEKQVKALGKLGEAIVTWGGREYYVEPPKFSEKYGKQMSFEYKLLNYLIQGSAADCTKEALIRYSGSKKDSRFLVTVYDEINISAPAKVAKKEMKMLKECMESIEFDCPMKTDGKQGPNWGDLTKEVT